MATCSEARKAFWQKIKRTTAGNKFFRERMKVFHKSSDVYYYVDNITGQKVHYRKGITYRRPRTPANLDF